MEFRHIVVFITSVSKEEADKIADVLVSSGLAACVNMVQGVKSVFMWKGKVEKADEVLLVVKTRREMFTMLMGEVKRLHSYEVPEIIALPLIGGSQDYLDWIDEVCVQKEGL